MSKRKTSSKGILFVVSAPSGTGKTTVVERLLRKDRTLRRTVSHTTRVPRPGERNGRDYYFVDEAAFRRLIHRGGLAEWARVYRDYYGTSHQTIRDCFRLKKDAVLVIEAKGAAQLRRSYPNAVFISVLPPSWPELRRRLRSRGGAAKDIARRLKEAKAEVKRMHWYDYVVINRRVADVVGELAVIVAAERKRLARNETVYRKFA